MADLMFRIIFCCLTMINRFEGAPTLPLTALGNYSQSLTLGCSDTTYTVGRPYTWIKNNATIFTQNGEQGTVGKYTKSESTGMFSITILDIVVSDEGIYKCSHNFDVSQESNVTVQSLAKREHTDGKIVDSGHVVILFKYVYPAFSSVVVTCNKRLISGSLTSVANGDRFDVEWKSTGVPDDVTLCDVTSIGGKTSYDLLALTIIGLVIFLAITWLILTGGGLGVCCVALILTGILIYVGRKGNIVFWNLSKWDILVAVLDFVAFLFSLIVGAYAVSLSDDCEKCTKCDMKDCDSMFGLGIVCIILACIILIVFIVFIIIRKGWCGERFTCLNTVLPVCKDTEARGPPDGKSDHPAAKEKHREVKLLTHKEQTQQHHKETVVNKGKTSGEKHEEPSKGQPRPLPVPTGNNRDDTGSAGAVSHQDVVLDRRPMPEIPSDRNKRGLSANYSDDRDKPLDDNILHTLPVVNKPKTALDPLNAEDQSKNADDQPKKKKKKKKDRDTSRSEEMEDGY